MPTVISSTHTRAQSDGMERMCPPSIIAMRLVFLDAPGLRADGRQERKGRGELSGEVMDAKVGAVRALFLCRDRKLDRLQQRVGRRAGPRLRRRSPVPEGEEADLTLRFVQFARSPCLSMAHRRRQQRSACSAQRNHVSRLPTFKSGALGRDQEKTPCECLILTMSILFAVTVWHLVCGGRQCWITSTTQTSISIGG